MKRYSLVKYLKYLLLAALALLLSKLAYQARMIKIDGSTYAEQFQQAFREQEDRTKKILNDFIEAHKSTDGKIIQEPEYLEKLENKYKKYGIILIIYENETLSFWSHNALPKQNYHPPEKTSGVVQKQNGWYYYTSQRIENQQHIAYCHFKKDFKYQNRFLVNAFQNKLPELENKFFISDRQTEGFPILDSQENYLFSLILRSETALYKPLPIIYFISLVSGIAAYILFIFFTFRYFTRIFRVGRRATAISGFILTVLLVRIVSFWLSIPQVFYDAYMFSPELYATSTLLPSLGDLFLNVSLVAIIAYFLFSNLRQIIIKPKKTTIGASLAGFALFTLIYLICGLSLYLIEALVINSRLNLDVNFIFELDIYSLVGFLVIGLIFFTFFFFSIVLCRLAYSILKTKSGFWINCAFSMAALMLITLLIFGFKPLLYMLAISATFIFELDRRKKTATEGFSALVISLFIFSVISTFALYRFNKEKDLEKRKTLVLQLASEQDPVAEFLFMEIEDALFKDNQLQNLVRQDPYNETAISNYLQYHYFYDFWAKYELQVTVCMPDELLLIKPANIEMPCAMFFDNYIDMYGAESISEHFIFLDNNTGRNSYISRIEVGHPVDNDELPLYHVYLEFDSKFIARDMGFPELLIDDAIDINRELINYSYATYKNGILVNEFGPFVYNIDINSYKPGDEEFRVFDYGGFSHLMYRKDDDTIIMISRPQSTLLEAVAPFSYLFITFFVIVAIFWLLVNRTRPVQLLKMNFRRRVQYSMIGILLISALTIGGVSTVFILNMYENKNMTFLNEKTHSVLRELELALADEYYLDYTMNYFLYDLLLQYSNVFFTDINLYNTEGFLIASSRPKVFEEGLVGHKMNAVAFHRMRHERKSQYIHNERIGKLEYLSAYTPLYNRYQEKLAYLNLPYFAKQGELRNELSYFLVAFINIYLLLVVLAVVLALFVSSHVTRPLQLIKAKLAHIEFGKSNEKISWSRDDEIGSLISEYNRMIDELAVSADLLARSERETAWREMARQVAHEIKNPLTPMKLNVQYLEKAWKEKLPGWDKRLQRFTKTMVEQIDNMSVIAREFSDFAQMPTGKNDRIELGEFVTEVIDLYKAYENLDIRLFLPKNDAPMYVHADRKQLLRVFNNLIKNAMQAYDKNETARIDVLCEPDDRQYKITITDYGCGIPEHQKQNIFNPYFTTKAKGMGLGLSMVKNIIESMKGRIDFTSTEGEGSSFVIWIPLYDPGFAGEND